jgi:hypothetical protein
MSLFRDGFTFFRCRPTIPSSSPHYQSTIADNAVNGVPNAIVGKVHIVKIEMLTVAPDLLQRDFF